MLLVLLGTGCLRSSDLTDRGVCFVVEEVAGRVVTGGGGNNSARLIHKRIYLDDSRPKCVRLCSVQEPRPVTLLYNRRLQG